MTSFWRGLLPAVPATPPREMVRAALGAGIALLLADLILRGLTGSGLITRRDLLVALTHATTDHKDRT